MPYKFQVEQKSNSFRDAPPVIIKALRRLTWAKNYVAGTEKNEKFNELLALAYLEGQKIGVSLHTLLSLQDFWLT